MAKEDVRQRSDVAGDHARGRIVHSRYAKRATQRVCPPCGDKEPSRFTYATNLFVYPGYETLCSNGDDRDEGKPRTEVIQRASACRSGREEAEVRTKKRRESRSMKKGFCRIRRGSSDHLASAGQLDQPHQQWKGELVSRSKELERPSMNQRGFVSRAALPGISVLIHHSFAQSSSMVPTSKSSGSQSTRGSDAPGCGVAFQRCRRCQVIKGMGGSRWFASQELELCGGSRG